MDSEAWHNLYGRNIALTMRLAAVRDHIKDCITGCPAGPIKIVSICAGDGRDLIGVLECHPRRQDVEAILIEVDSKVVGAGQAAALSAGLERQVTFICGDASLTATYKQIEPANIILFCGVLGSVDQKHTKGIVGVLCAISKLGSTIVWTRNLDKRDGRRHCQLFSEALHASNFKEIRKEIVSRRLLMIRRPDRYLINTFKYEGATCALSAEAVVFEFGATN